MPENLTYLYPETVIAGCGNPLFADDGFGPAVIEELKRIRLPGNVKTVDAGTGAPDLLFGILDPADTKKLVVIDIVDFGMKPGTIIKFDLLEFFPDDAGNPIQGEIVTALLPLKKKFRITIVGCQPKSVPFPLMEIGLSEEVRSAIPSAIKTILNLLEVDYCSLCCFMDILKIKIPDKNDRPAAAPRH